ncbi:MAG TPA: alpha/beta fold hydrolase [Cyclobacteriaceae bacterium]|nr:alpha/beta fold hydrolase [Cyclobacteriaceae bacterium]
MPLITGSSYRRPFYLFNGHLETIIPSAFRKVAGPPYRRERLELPEGDFLDLDWLENGSRRLVIISHGLEGSSDRHYSKGMANFFFKNGWDALAWNCRSCSGEMNRLPRFYHHGATEDLNAVIVNALKKGYETIALVGISMGGSLSLKYAGENAENLPVAVKRIVAFSVPCHLASSARELDKPAKTFYLNRFLKKLGRKIELKATTFPDIISHRGFDKIRSFEEFDNKYTAPLHGFRDARDFYERASSLPHIANITIPTLIVNALNDPFLPLECFPYDIARESKYVFLETPKHGGHTGFTLAGKEENWMEVRAFEFVNSPGLSASV